MDICGLIINVITISTKVAVISSEEGESWILHTNVRTIERLELNTWTNRTLIGNQIGAIAVDYHYTQGYIYWADQIDDRIQRASLSNTSVTEDIHTSGIDRADAIAVDWIYNHLYWIDYNHEHIVVSQLDGKLRKTLIKDNLVSPRGLVVHPGIGWVFFSDIKEPKIEKCGLDGSSRTTLVTSERTNLDDPNGLAIDFQFSRLYWIDNVFKEIRTCKFDGTDIKLLVQSQDYMPWAWGLAIYKEWIYWTNFNNHSIARIEKTTGNNIGFIKTNMNNPVGIKIYSSDNQPSGTNLCIKNNVVCDHLCLASPQNTVTCACTDGFQLKSDGRGCLNIGSGTWLTYANLKTIERLDLETNVTQTIAKDVENAVDLDIHYEKGLVYWTDVSAHKISRRKVSRDSVSNEVEDIITDRIITPDGLAIDWIYDLLYWTDTGLNHIQVSRLDGKDRKTIIKDSSLDQPRAIAIDPNSGLLFFSDWGIHSRIERCTMDGTNRQVIVQNSIIWPNGMSIDHIGKRLYWIDGRLNKIESIRFDGTDRFTLIENTVVLPKPYDLVVYASNVYWSNWQNRTILSLNKYSIKDFKVIALYLRSPMGITMYGEGLQPIDQNLCEGDNGGCSHICYPLPTIGMTASIASGCMCPDGLTLSSNNKTCITPGQDVSSSTTVISTGSTIGTTKNNDKLNGKHSPNPDGGNSNATIIGASLGSVIVVLVAILISVYCRRLHNKKAEQRHEANQPNSAYHCIIDDTTESQSTAITKVEANPYETISATNLKSVYEENIYDEVNLQASGSNPQISTKLSTQPGTIHGVGIDNPVFEGSNPSFCKPQAGIYLDPTC